MRIKSAETRSRIVDAAYQSFWRSGFTRTSIDGIAERAEVTKRTVYAHFRSKDDLLAAVLVHYRELAAERLKRIGDRMPADRDGLIDSYFGQLVGWASTTTRWSGSGFTRLVVELADLPGHPARAIARRAKAETEAWLAGKLAKVWGEVRPAAADKAKLMAKYKAELTPTTLKKANLANGRALYVKSCATCHRLFGEGGDIGPDLTGSQRTNLDYILENVLDPSAIVPKEYQVTVVVTTAGRTLSGIVKKESEQALTLQLPNEVVVVPKGEIESRTPTRTARAVSSASRPKG